MALKYPNKRKRSGYWKRYERASIKNYLLVWNTILSFIDEKEIPFCFAKRGRKPKLARKEYVAISAMQVYFDIDFRELEYITALLAGKHLDHTNCVRWFGRLTLPYIDNVVFAVHQEILKEVPSSGDYITDASLLTCDRLIAQEERGETVLEHLTWKMHLLVMYLWDVGLISVVSIFATAGYVHENPIFRKCLLQKKRLIEGRKCHADKGFFGKENIKKCKKSLSILNRRRCFQLCRYAFLLSLTIKDMLIIDVRGWCEIVGEHKGDSPQVCPDIVFHTKECNDKVSMMRFSASDLHISLCFKSSKDAFNQSSVLLSCFVIVVLSDIPLEIAITVRLFLWNNIWPQLIFHLVNWILLSLERKIFKSYS